MDRYRCVSGHLTCNHVLNLNRHEDRFGFALATTAYAASVAPATPQAHAMTVERSMTANDQAPQIVLQARSACTQSDNKTSTIRWRDKFLARRPFVLLWRHTQRGRLIKLCSASLNPATWPCRPARAIWTVKLSSCVTVST